MDAKVCAGYDAGPIGAEACAEARNAEKQCAKKATEETSTSLELRGGQLNCNEKCNSAQWGQLADLSNIHEMAVVGAVIRPLWEILHQHHFQTQPDFSEMMRKRAQL